MSKKPEWVAPVRALLKRTQSFTQGAVRASGTSEFREVRALLSNYPATHEPKAEPRLLTEGWQPIETAPKDGSEGLVGCWVYADEKRRIRRWSCWYIDFNGGDLGCDGEWGDEPTHWMPLPPPPPERGLIAAEPVDVVREALKWAISQHFDVTDAQLDDIAHEARARLPGIDDLARVTIASDEGEAK